MKRIILGIVCILISGYAYSEVAHPEDPDIVGDRVYANGVCFNNDGALTSFGECDNSSVDEGLVLTGPNWYAPFSGINGCGTGAVNPVSSAACPFTITTFATCTPNEWVLVQTTKSGHFWAIKAGTHCYSIPASAGLIPCLQTDAFDPVRGCYPINNQSSISVEGGYIKLETATTPAAAHCDDVSHEGRMIVDSVNDLLYICTQSGWITK